MRIEKSRRVTAVLAAAALAITITEPGEASAVVYRTGDLTFDNFNTDSTLTVTDCQRSAQGRVLVPDNINGRGVASIAPKAFFSCMEITEIRLPEYMDSIGMSAFSHCYMLESAELPMHINEIGGSAFAYCSALENVILPDGITEIGGSTFYGCTSLRSVTIPPSVTEIGSSAFSQCTSLSDIYFWGTREDWDRIDIGMPNSELSRANIYFMDIDGTSGTIMPEDEQPTQAAHSSAQQPTQPVQSTQPATEYDPHWSGWGSVIGGGGGGYGDDLLPGDANGDGKVNVSDAVAVLQFIADHAKYPIDGAQYLNADCDGELGITGSDAQYIQMIDAGLR